MKISEFKKGDLVVYETRYTADLDYKVVGSAEGEVVYDQEGFFIDEIIVGKLIMTDDYKRILETKRGGSMANSIYKIGDIVRYDHGQTALMKIKEISHDHGQIGQTRYYGKSFYGSAMGVYWNDCSPASSVDKMVWNKESFERDT